ncbi:39S ribosomal protein L16, mitochondrial [Schistocerca americana]|nr:39S ribosomal protein L16, mitochondrial [Schistocerca americana]XP_047098943.1 39S ribosomal protein L16, mitochondrial [Schistocerca piceifrons]XP_049786395.1 39S ribosomal protein L16, mitochondrial isoform X1 [Schistocerca cancellata]XP_049808417.1 39S ribosomal protein L16, mitochondrial isoform X1 [Schistocerca nitens]XP_049964604.1 39S ribosomal protein L16, mitochondrial isoform X1 [Schistocerca serialis cubense]
MMRSNLVKILNSSFSKICAEQTAGMKHFPPPPKYDDIEFPERARLRFMDKVPQYPPSVRPPKMMKRLLLMRGPELVHNELLHRQYGIIATGGGRLKWGHFEMIRLGILRKMDDSRMFAIWRIDAPWQSVTKKGQGQRMGGGKGPIDHYVTPVKAGRVIVEVGGKCEFAEVKGFLEMIAQKLPFKAKVVSHEMLQKMKEDEERREKENMNPYTFKYVIQNNMGGYRKWLSKADYKWYGKYV